MSPDEPKTTFAVTKKVNFLVYCAISPKFMVMAIVSLTKKAHNYINTLIINYL